jgi:hypothetical protein
MGLRGFAVLVLAVSASSLFGATAIGPVVNNGTIKYQKNQVTLNGSGFEPAKAAPVLLLDGTALTVDSFSSAEIVATLPARTAAGTYTLTVVNSQEVFTVFDLTYGAAGPTGPTGPTGPHGPQGTVLSYSASGILPGTLKDETGAWGRFSALILKSPGVYRLSGEIALTNLDSSYSAYPYCQVFDASGAPQGAPHPGWQRKFHRRLP